MAQQGSSTIAIHEYQRHAQLHIMQDPLPWWKSKIDYEHVKDLVPLSMKWLAIPATSCPSECLFSTAGDVITESRNRISSDNVDMILFLNRNC